jgi:AcrR family transcriptional regulator
MSDEQSQRRWAGTTLDVRRAARREQLIAAGFALLGEQGASAVSVRGVARTARLSERYFYESFPDREALLLAVHDRVAEQARARIAAAVGSTIAAAADPALTPAPPHDPGIRADAPLSDPATLGIAGLSAFTDFLEEDPRRGRVLLQEAFADQALARHGVELLPSFAALLVEQISARFEEPDTVDAELSAVALVGALAHLYLSWIDGSLSISRERLIRHAARLLVAAAGVSSHD